MKLTAALMTFILSCSAFAEIQTPIHQLSQVSYNGEMLNLAYFTGGGCEAHTPLVKVDIQEVNNTEATVKVIVLDVTKKYDGCEAYIEVTGEVNLKKIVLEELKSIGFKGYKINLQLPSIQMSAF